MSKDLPYMPLWVGDWKSGTAGMSPEAAGAYMRLLIHQWEFGTVPKDRKKLCRITGVFPDEWADVWAEISPKFTEEKGGMFNPKCRKVWEQNKDKVQRLSDAGKAGAMARWKGAENGNRNGDANGNRNANANANAIEKRCDLDGSNHAPSELHILKEIEQHSSTAREDAERTPFQVEFLDDYHRDLHASGCRISPQSYRTVRDQAKTDGVWTDENRREWVLMLSNQLDTVKNGHAWLKARTEIAAKKSVSFATNYAKQRRGDGSNDFRD